MAQPPRSSATACKPIPAGIFQLEILSKTIRATLIDRNIDPKTNQFTFGTAGIAGKRLDKPHRHTGPIFLATGIAAFARSLKETSSGIFGAVPRYSPKNAGIEGASAVVDRHAEFLLEKAGQTEKILAVPAGIEFYLHTQENTRFDQAVLAH